jgi:uncharacterized protein YkwD
MKFVKEPPSGTITTQFMVRSVILTLLFVASLTICQRAAAQEIKLQPVARLITDPVNDPNYSRARKVAGDGPYAVAKASLVTSPSLDQATEIERRAFEKTNQARVQNGMTALTWDAQLCRMARTHSEYMARGGFFSHQTPEGLELKGRARQSGILHFRVIGENIAYNKGYDDPGGFAVERWLISSAHRANMLYTGFQAAAIGSYVAADGTVYLTQVFITR